MTTPTIDPRVATAGQARGPALAEPAPSLVVKPVPKPRPGRILVVDDEHLAAISLKQSLRALGYEPLGPARDGSHAVQLSFYLQPDLVLMDIRMATDQDGIDAAAALYGEMAIPVIIVSAHSGSEQTSAASKAGVFGFLVKPATTDQLRAALDIAWARYTEAIAAETVNADLHRRLDDRQTVERAKWLLVERHSISEGAAMDAMRQRSHDEHRSLVEVARDVLS